MAGLLFANPASAALIEQDLFAAGDGLITFDDQTGLEWLDLTETTNLSYNDVETDGGGWLSLGFRHATGAEVCDLMAAYAAFDPGCSGSPLGGGGLKNSAPFTGNDLMMSLLGITAVVPNDCHCP